MTANPLVNLAQAADAWRSRDMPDPVLYDARRAVLDWFAAMLKGCGIRAWP